MRPGRLETTRLTQAFVISLAVHLLLFATFRIGNRQGWWQKVHLPIWLVTAKQSLADVLKEMKKSQAAEREVPLLFVDVNPAQASAEPPKSAKYYSDKNSIAANPDADKETAIPKINGTQNQIVKTEEVPRTKAFPLQPTPPAPRVEPVEESKPKLALAPGDLTLAKPAEIVRRDDGQGKESRPRTIQQALARQQQRVGLAGEKMKQDGGVKRRALESSLDVQATPFGAYDAAIIDAVQRRWYYLLDSRDFARDRTGKVMLEFRLNYDGRITDMKVAENTVDELLCLLCQKAVMDPAPYAAWPSDLRRLVGADYREVRFTFFYN